MEEEGQGYYWVGSDAEEEVRTPRWGRAGWGSLGSNGRGISTGVGDDRWVPPVSVRGEGEEAVRRVGPKLAGLGWFGLGWPSSVGPFFYMPFLFFFFLFYFITFDLSIQMSSNLFLKFCKNQRIVLGLKETSLKLI
jgi:hypothetical protein